jgi:hypothetical protein
MTREAFIRKWLANPQKQYNEQCRDEMRDDLDLVIEAALRQPPDMRSVCTCRNSELEKGSLVPVFCHTCNAYVQTDL